MDLGTDYCYAGGASVSVMSLARRFFGCYISGMSCLLSAGYPLTEDGGRSCSFRQAIAHASYKGGLQ